MLGFSPIPFRAPKQTEIPFSYFSFAFDFSLLASGWIKMPAGQHQRKRRKEVQIAFFSCWWQCDEGQNRFGIPRLFSPPLALQPSLQGTKLEHFTDSLVLRGPVTQGNSSSSSVFRAIARFRSQTFLLESRALWMDGMAMKLSRARKKLESCSRPPSHVLQ